MEFKPGIYPGISRADYDSVIALNQSSIKLIGERHVKAAWTRLHHPDDPSQAMIEGSAFHAMLFEPNEYEQRFAAYPRYDKRTKAGKALWEEWEAENAGKWHLSIEKMLELQSQVHALLAHPVASRWIDQAVYHEFAVFWTHPTYGFPCKALVDAVSRDEGLTWVWDAKTTRDATPGFWAREIANRSYIVQAAWTLDGLDQIAMADREFAFVALETGGFMDVAIYRCGPLSLFEARHRIEKACKKWARALETGVFPGATTEIQTLEVPRWALTHERDEEALEYGDGAED
jgi:hypothetical protein